MEDSLRCVKCKNFAIDAVQSDCECHLLYCEGCCANVTVCSKCNQRLSANNSKPEQYIYGFTNNVLARRMIGSIKTTCKQNDCGYQTTLGEILVHEKKCDNRQYVCAYCQNLNIDGKAQFMQHIKDKHEELFLSIFDQKLYGKAFKQEVDRIYGLRNNFRGMLKINEWKEEEKQGKTGSFVDLVNNNKFVVDKAENIEKIEQWSCPICLLINNHNGTQCEGCKIDFDEKKFENKQQMMNQLQKNQESWSEVNKIDSKKMREKLIQDRKRDKKGADNCVIF
ncbi:uncharacterized protein loc101236893 [Stylonychia lemnae]|uniref:Uncharacterized protein loc101236893 n=1 Tax=Stylonychia lemnae TaxID=5949 RepID=A0A078AZR6_STYLE|nr:uncharacterized protein loc101236893 [Stylonychia lemnae]|eukprot:CDW87900.1 uncharacterized protein loc101236893 [Stylonychia lemnae]